jgi:hypothetical protein
MLAVSVIRYADLYLSCTYFVTFHFVRQILKIVFLSLYKMCVRKVKYASD